MRICSRCDRAIRDSEFETFCVDSMSGARPDQHTHRRDDPKCRPITAADPTDTH